MKRFFIIMIVAMSMTTTMAQEVVEHVLQRGETIESVAKKYGVSVADLQEVNPDIANMTYVGMKIKIPQKKHVESTESEDNSISVESSNNLTTGIETIATNTETTTIVQDTEPVIVSDGLLSSAGDFSVLLRPKDKVYGLYYGNQLNKNLYMGYGYSMAFTDHGSSNFFFGIGWGNKYVTGPILLQANIYPYLGLNSYDVLEIKVDSKGRAKENWKNKNKFTYGLQASLGAGLCIYTNKKGGRTFLTVGYYFGAAEFKTDKMLENGQWMVGITVGY